MSDARRVGWTRLALTLALILALAWSIGLAGFAERAMQPPPPPPLADGIVVLTGGAGRIEAALSLLEQRRARLLLISGVQPRLDLAQLLRGDGLVLPRGSGLGARITLGHAATSTVGNAIETSGWAHANGLHRLIVVTAGYHMQRALAEIGDALPNAALLPYPVLPPALLRPGSFATLRLLVTEYDKWLLVASGLSELRDGRRRA